MAREPRIQSPAAIYHVMNRSDLREPAEQEGRRIVAEALSEEGLRATQLQRLPASAELKVRLARGLRRETALGLKHFPRGKYTPPLPSTTAIELGGDSLSLALTLAL